MITLPKVGISARKIHVVIVMKIVMGKMSGESKKETTVEWRRKKKCHRYLTGTKLGICQPSAVHMNAFLFVLKKIYIQ